MFKEIEDFIEENGSSLNSTIRLSVNDYGKLVEESLPPGMPPMVVNASKANGRMFIRWVEIVADEDVADGAPIEMGK